MNATEDIVDVMLHHDFQRYGAVMRIVGPAKAYRGTTLPAEDRTVREGSEMVKVLHLRGKKTLECVGLTKNVLRIVLVERKGNITFFFCYFAGNNVSMNM